MPRKAVATKTPKTVEKKTVEKELKSKVSKTKETDEKLLKKQKVVESVKDPDSLALKPSDAANFSKNDTTELNMSDVELPDSFKKNRRVPTKESVLEGFDELVSFIDEEILRLRDNPSKSKGIKFLRSLGKSVKSLRSQSVRVMKQKHKSVRTNNTNSGFLKPVQISKDMAKFTGWDSSELKSRVDVTKYICNYIRENNLQNPSDRRQILADKKLSKLLDYNPDKDDKPLTYYRIQSYMKKHFTEPSKDTK
jgi:chromatin remodeling complex protein RSC6